MGILLQINKHPSIFFFFLVILFICKLHITYIQNLFNKTINHSLSLHPSYSRSCFFFFFFFVYLFFCLFVVVFFFVFCCCFLWGFFVVVFSSFYEQKMHFSCKVLKFHFFFFFFFFFHNYVYQQACRKLSYSSYLVNKLCSWQTKFI